MNFTPGKWTVQPFKHQIFIDSDNHYIADMFKEHQSREEQLANANLIAATPELFEALKNLIKRDLIKDKDGDHYQECLDAISKAKGE